MVAPVGARRVAVETAAQMRDAVLDASAGADALVMAAAVADFRPKTSASNKLKTRDGTPQLELEATDDILKLVAKQHRPRVVIGFAAESKDLIGNASGKLRAKKLDLIVANDITAPEAGFGSDTNRITLIDAAQHTESLPLAAKSELADVIIGRLARLLE